MSAELDVALEAIGEVLAELRAELLTRIEKLETATREAPATLADRVSETQRKHGEAVATRRSEIERALERKLGPGGSLPLGSKLAASRRAWSQELAHMDPDQRRSEATWRNVMATRPHEVLPDGRIVVHK